MKARVLLVVLATAFAAGVIFLFNLHFAAGDVYPPYSSMRADPSGAKLLYDSLAHLPQLTLNRNLVPLPNLSVSAATILILGIRPAQFSGDLENLAVMEHLAGKGNRLVLAMGDDYDPTDELKPDLYAQWGVRMRIDRTLYFTEAHGWRVIDRAGPKLRIVERSFGSGVIELCAESSNFANFATANGDSLNRIVEAIGPNTRVVFDEAHFGIEESGSIVGLARRFHLTGFAIGLAICAALFLWRIAAAFPPPATALSAAHRIGRTSQAGLLTLLRRHIPSSELAAACWREWLAVNRRSAPADRIQRAAALIESSGEPIEVVRQTHSLLKIPRGVLKGTP